MSRGTKVCPHFEPEGAPVDDSAGVKITGRSDGTKEDHNNKHKITIK